MNKKFFLYLMAIVMVAMLGVNFTSCGNDDEDYGTGPVAGKWECYLTDGSSRGTLTFIFKDDNVTYIEKWSEPGYDDDIETYTGVYVVENDIISMTLTRLRDDGTSWYSNAYVFKFEINGKKLTLTANNYWAKDYFGQAPMVFTRK